MTEQEWLKCTDPHALLNHLQSERVHYSKQGRRRIRLIACACCRLVGHLLLDPQSQQCLEVAEQFADGEATLRELKKAHRAGKKALVTANRACAPREKNPRHVVVANYRMTQAVVEATTHEDIITRANAVARFTAQAEIAAFEHISGEAHQTYRSRLEMAEKEILSRQASLMRDIFHNPFRPCAAPDRFPEVVVRLSKSLYNGEDCGFALHDALVEAGRPELAVHFQEKHHFKGCWALDLILEKQ